MDLKKMGQTAQSLTTQMAAAPLHQKNEALARLIDEIKTGEREIRAANAADVAQAEAQGLSAPLLERLSLKNKLPGIIGDLQQIITLPDPLGEPFDLRQLPNGLQLMKYRVPLGVLGVIYESRPNVTVDISALAIKSGNCVLLKGGSEACHTNQLLVEMVQRALAAAGLPPQAVQLLAHTNRVQMQEFIQMDEYIDLIIPRGSATLQAFCRENSTIPVITGGVGICHLFVDQSADLARSLQVILNAKIQRPTVCNALDTLLVHAQIAPTFIPAVIELLKASQVTFRLDPAAHAYSRDPAGQLAQAQDWDTEWLSLVLGIKVVADVEAAIAHIRLHSTGHSDGILTEDQLNAARFIQAVDSAVVYVNASTRFTDGGQFGLGAEVAISTQKLHARGPMGLHELTSYKWVVQGDYHVRS